MARSPLISRPPASRYTRMHAMHVCTTTRRRTGLEYKRRAATIHSEVVHLPVTERNYTLGRDGAWLLAAAAGGGRCQAARRRGRARLTPVALAKAAVGYFDRHAPAPAALTAAGPDGL